MCWACAWCNVFKGIDVAAYAPGSDQLVPLFDPRTDAWSDHFYLEGAVLRGKTGVALATIELLRINRPERIDHRQLLIQLGLWT